MGITKGTFYYHFPNKEQTLKALVLRTIHQVEQQARGITASSAPAADKLAAIMSAARLMNIKTELVDQFHAPGNTEFHLLSITAMIGHPTPILAKVITQGIAEGTFTTERPRDVTELLLNASGILLNQDIMKPNPAELTHRQETLIWASETPLGTVPGSLGFLTKAEP